VDLSDNTNLWGVHPASLEAIRTAPEEAVSRYPSVYGSELKDAVADRHGLSLDSVATGCGSDDLLDSVFRASAFPPGRMSFPAPSFSMVPVFAHMNGMEAFPVPWRKAEMDPGRLLLEDPDLVYVCRPNNPTGASLEREWLLTLLALGGPEGPLVVLDEAYADFADDSFILEAPFTDRLLVLRTFSKLYGLAGLRVGVAVGPPTLVQEMEKARGPYKLNRLGERAAVAALRGPSEWEDQIRQQTRENRRRLAEELTARGLRPLPSDANFLLVPVEPADVLEVNRALRDRGVTARPFPSVPGIGDALRVTVGPWELMERFLGALDELLEPFSLEEENT
jgi:histidinol-phosphate aminotransferase